MERAPDVCILGTGSTGPVQEDPRSIPEMVLDAVERALNAAQIDWDGFDAVVTASVDLLDGLTASNIAVTEVVGAVMRPETRIAADGLAAVAHAVAQIQAGAYERVLVVAWAKASMASYWDLSAWAMDPIALQPLGVDFRVMAGLQASLLAREAPSALGDWADLVSVRRRTGKGWAPQITPAEVLDASPWASPLTTEMVAPLGDGAAAVILAKGGDRGNPIIRGVGLDLSPHPPALDLTRWSERACRRSLTMAGITSEDLTHAEPSCLFPFEEALFSEACGLPPGCTVSSSGGLYGGTAPIVAGLTRLIEAASLPAGSLTLAHGTWGPVGQGQVTMVVGT